MKSLISVIAVASIAIFSVVSCTNDSVSPNQTPPNLSDDSAWRVTWYWDKDKDETSDFAPYTFYFRSGGIFDAISNNGTVSGTWRITSYDGTHRLVINSALTKPLSDLNDDWIILSSDEQKMQLKDDNDTHLEELVFERQ